MFSMKTLAVVFTAFVVHSALAHDCTRKYIVKEGDICDSISAANQVSTYQLAVVNHDVIDSACSNLAPGQEICLGTAGEDCSTTYVVKADDTCDAINEAHGLNNTVLYANNPQINEACNNLYIGEVVCVAQNVQVPAAPASGIPATTIPSTAIPAVPSPTVEAPAPPPPAPTPTAAPTDSKNDNTGDEDCDDEEDHDDNDDNDGDDDEDLPFCDEI